MQWALVKPVGELEAAVRRSLQPHLELEGYNWSVTDSYCYHPPSSPTDPPHIPPNSETATAVTVTTTP